MKTRSKVLILAALMLYVVVAILAMNAAGPAWAVRVWAIFLGVGLAVPAGIYAALRWRHRR